MPRPDDAARLPADSSDTFAPSAAPRDFGADQTPASAASPDEDGGTNWLLWIGGLLALILAGLAAIIFARRATGQRAPATAPQIVKPKPRPAAGAVPAAVSGSLASPPSSPDRPASSAPVVAAASGPLGLAMTSRSLSLSLMAATLDYELTLINSGSEPMHGLEVQGDMIGAHASLSSDDQVASATRPMETRHELAELLPGEQQMFRGQLRLPFSAIRAVAQGRSPLLVPLSRWRVTARDSQLEPLVQTFLVGQKSDRRQQGIQPFRLDIGPGVFSQLVQRSFA